MRVKFMIAIYLVLLSSAFSGATAQSFFVADHNGIDMGSVIGLVEGGVTAVAIEVGGQTLPVFITRSQFQATSNTLWFTTANCTGQAYAIASYSPFSATQILPTQSGTMLYGENGPSQSITGGSYFYNGTNSCQETLPASMNMVPMAPMLNLSTFVSPFSVHMTVSGRRRR